jgi:hypothetical protein
LGNSEDGGALEVVLKPASQSVSAMSSLLREVQAALREAARAAPQTASLFEGDQAPLLTVRFESAAGGVALVFEFVNAASRAPLAEVSTAVAKRFIVALEAGLKRRPHRTLWGQPAVPGRRRGGDAGRGDALSERAAVVLAELGRVPSASISGGGRRIRIDGETAEIL